MIDVCNQEPEKLLALSEAIRRIAETITPISESVLVPIEQALGRILAETVYSPVDLPHERNAAMDGYAFVSSDLIPGKNVSLTQAGTSWAGRPYLGELKPMQCVRIFTGAVVPALADSVIMQEHVTITGDKIIFPDDACGQQNIRHAGEDINCGDCLLKATKKLTACDLGLLAATGIDTVKVIRPVTVGYFSTGDELIPVGQPLASGKIYDSNRYLLSGLLPDYSYQVTDLGLLPDNKETIAALLLAASKQYDVIITTGGASVGDADYIKDVLHESGRVEFWKIAIKPGKPLAFGKLNNSYFFGLPGNPAAVLTTCQQVVAPALRRLSGTEISQPLRLRASLTTTIKKSPGREEFQRGWFMQDETGAFQVKALPKQGSHVLSSMSEANCYIVLPASTGVMQSGEEVTIEPFTLLLPMAF